MIEMEQNAMISVSGTQNIPGEAPETIELVTRGTYCYEPGKATVSYVETQMTGLEGVLTTFTVEDGARVTLERTGKVNSRMEFAAGNRCNSLYDVGDAALLLTVHTRSVTVLLNANGGIFDLEYDLDIENTHCGTNQYHIEVRLT